jgi:hypothetical protein
MKHRLLTTVLGLLSPVAAFAQFSALTSATAQYEYNSNVFDLQSGFPVLGYNGQPITGPDEYRLDDSFYAYRALANLKYAISKQTVFLNATAADYVYDHFGQLTHSEYNFDGGWNGNIGTALNGGVDVIRINSMVAFTDLNSTQLTLQTVQRENANIGLQLAPNWRIEANGYYRTVSEPLPQTPALELYETQGTTLLRYVANAGLNWGLSATYQKGHFTGAPETLDPAYSQRAADLFANFFRQDGSGVTGDVGYSQRTSVTGLNNTAGVVGSLGYQKQLTGKTSVQLQVTREIDTYLTNTGSEIESRAILSFNWQATYKIDVVPTYTWQLREFPDQGNTPTQTRIDHLEFGGIVIIYQPLTWLAVRPYANIQTRSSNLIGGSFNGTIAGISFVATWSRGAAPNAALNAGPAPP